MKRILLLIVILSCFSFSQNAPSEANVILIVTKDKPESAFRNIGRLFVSENFEIQTSEPALLLITTKLTTVNYGFLNAGRLSMILKAQIDEQDTVSIITMTGIFDDGIVIENHGMGGSPAKASFEKMDEIAKMYKNGSVSYEIRKKK